MFQFFYSRRCHLLKQIKLPQSLNFCKITKIFVEIIILRLSMCQIWMYYIYYMLIFHKKNMLCICCNARESRTIAEILKSKFLGRGSRTTFCMSAILNQMLNPILKPQYWAQYQTQYWTKYSSPILNPILDPILNPILKPNIEPNIEPNIKPNIELQYWNQY